MAKGLDICTFEVDDSDNVVIMDFNSFVDVPAHMKPFITFSGQKAKFSGTQQQPTKKVYAVASDKERVVMGVLISAGTPIYRNDNGYEYYGIFTKATITKIKDRFMQQGFMHNVNTMHDPKKVVKGAFMTEIFQIDSKKGVACPGCLKDQNLQDGTLIGAYKITDDKVWSDIESGDYRGFSIEAYLDIKKAKVKKSNMKKSKLAKVKKDKMGKLSEIAKWDVVVDQDTYEVGSSLTTTWKDADNGDVTSKLSDGEYVTEDGKRILVDSDGIVRLVFKERVNIKKANMSKERTGLFRIPKFFTGEGSEEETKVFAEATTSDGTILKYEGELGSGTPVFIEVNDEDTPAVEGEYEVTLSDGSVKLIVIDANGVVSSVEDVQEMSEEGEAILAAVEQTMSRKMSAMTKKFEALESENKKLRDEVEALKKDRKGSKFDDKRQPSVEGATPRKTWTSNK